LDAVTAGLSLQAFDKVMGLVSPGDQSFGFRVIPKATLARRRRVASPGKHATQKLSAEESARVMRLARMWAMARQVWQDDETARDFLFRPHPLLEDRKPIDVVLANEFGLPIVENVLGALLYGAAA